MSFSDMFTFSSKAGRIVIISAHVLNEWSSLNGIVCVINKLQPHTALLVMLYSNGNKRLFNKSIRFKDKYKALNSPMRKSKINL